MASGFSELEKALDTHFEAIAPACCPADEDGESSSQPMPATNSELGHALHSYGIRLHRLAESVRRVTARVEA